MKKILFLGGFLILTLALVGQSSSVAYLSQTPPGDSAIIFAPDIISLSTRHESAITISADGKEIYFDIYTDTYHTLCTKYENGNWTEPDEPSFSKELYSTNPYITMDGKNMLTTNWHLNSSNIYTNSSIYMFKRTSNDWGPPQLLPNPINANLFDAHITQTLNGDAYISSKRIENHSNDTIANIWHVSNFLKPNMKATVLPSGVNTVHAEGWPSISSDGSYMVFTSNRPNGIGNYDLYVTFKLQNDLWSEPINLEKAGAGINIPKNVTISSFLTHDGKYLFFGRHNESYTKYDIHWVSTSIIDDLKKMVVM